MALQIQTSNEFNPSSVCFSTIRKNKVGGKAVYLSAPGGKKLYLQLPFMRAPYGVGAYTDEATNRTSYSLDLAFDPDNVEAVEIAKKFSELDSMIVDAVAKNSKEWLGKQYNVAVLKEALYKPLIRPGKEQYPSTMKLKVLTKPDGTFIPQAYDMTHNMIPLESVEKGQRMCCIVDMVQIWFIDNKFGVSVRLQQVLTEQSAKLPSFAFVGMGKKAAAPMAEDEDEVEMGEVDDE